MQDMWLYATMHTCCTYHKYHSQKSWWELNLADCPQPMWTKMLADFYLVYS